MWGELDYLIMDLSPSTRDVPLALSKSVPLTGTVIVTTPQRAALRVVLEALKIWHQSGVPIMGLGEDMSYIICPGCGTWYDIFGLRRHRESGLGGKHSISGEDSHRPAHS